MNFLKTAFASTLVAALVGCGGGDININANDNSVFEDNSTGGSASSESITCASFVDENGVTQSGVVDGDNCLYSESFVDFDNPILSSVTLSDIGDGAHVFAGSLFVGENFATLAEATDAGILDGGDGPTLTIREGVTVALQSSQDFIAIRRGSRIEAQGSPTAPITFTSEDDVRGLVTAEQVQTWGGMVITGFGFTNACNYQPGFDRDNPDASDLLLAVGTDCSVQIEGTEGASTTHYGGTVHDDNSGTLSYVVVKHAGFAITDGNELNGITFGAVGSGTTLNNVEVYSNFDDGIEFFGGSADLTNYLAMYVRDDSIDIDEGYFGAINNALVIQGDGSLDNSQSSGAHCVESDGSSGSLVAQNIANDYVSKAVINNLTCIVSPTDLNITPDGGPGAGINAEEGHNLTVNASLITTAYDVDGVAGNAFGNYCFQLEDDEDLQNAADGLININTSIFACADISSNRNRDADIVLPMGTDFNGETGLQFLEAQDNVIFQAADDGTSLPNGNGLIAGQMTILDSFYSVPLADMRIDAAAVTFTNAPADGLIGGVSREDDWTQGWTFGLHEGSRAQPLWFE